MLKLKKKRKPRTNPDNNLNFDGSHIFGWPWLRDTPANVKLRKRFQTGVCLGCGMQECRCKSKFDKTHFKD